MFRSYYYLTKPGIIYGNAISAIAGFLLASKLELHPRLFLAMLFGLSLVIGAACVFNNLYDKDIDSKMSRTQNRATVTGKISTINAMVFGVTLFLLGIVILNYASMTALIVALIGFIVYVFIYTPLKPQSMYATLVGSVAGAVPPVVGYTAVTNKFDLGAALLFLILVTWQMPHFYAIAIRRSDEYAAAGVPVLPLKKGTRTAQIHILVYIIGFIVATSLLAILGFASFIYLTIALLMGLIWLWFGFQGFRMQSDVKLWAKKMFLFSLLVLLVLCFTISIDPIIKSKL